MADYSAIIAKVARKIAAKGMPMTFVKHEEGVYDPATNTQPVTETPIPVVGLRTVPTVDEAQSGFFAVGSTIVLVAAADLAGIRPDPTDRLEFDGHRWDIGPIKKVAPAEQPLLYKFQVKDAGAIR